mmetsp:Transcript_7611/g.16695  ORF Transcript_7611/g.16695 Transcript_7611/m.16695 type:complete len:646 (+) Transcript_7611:195-2132(+)|eukprot:CAMPEP_0178495676 /NCGR_PEP_ID=MMETSP0696-20121128/13678_1 /TAXON_ID=265572 /ORGANISM="Extubocellulus spinifer, Strain CCMP396" /LENGTH=645 /DNA_ID=CAMNT_0020123843 /DNA_START=127 /DNA_END=2064 /DNA_ORIENTATION=-
MSGATGTTEAAGTPTSGGGSSATRKRATYGRRLDKFGFIVEGECGTTCEESPSPSRNGGDGGGVRNCGDNDIDGSATSDTAEVIQHELPRRAPSASEFASDESDLSTLREKKWSKMMANWERTTHKRKRKLRRRIRKGVPSSVRGQVWTMLAGVPGRIEETDVGRYEELMTISGQTEDDDDEETTHINIDQASDRNRVTPRATRETIERDINRTFPRHYLFADSSDDDDSDDDENSDYQLSERFDRDRVPVWSKSDTDAATAAAARVMEANPEGGRELMAELNAVLGPVGTPTNSDLSGGSRPTSRTRGTRKSQLPDRISDAVIPSHNGMPTTMKKKLFSAMQQCNANLDQVDLSGIEMPEDGVVPTSFMIPTPTGSKEEGSESNNNNNNKQSPLASARKLTRKLTREEKRELKNADYARAKGGQASLRRVLRAYSVYDPSVGYCQGMNFIAAMFIAITHQEDDDDEKDERKGEAAVAIKRQEEEAFWLLTTVMSDAPFMCRELFGEGMSGAHRVLYVAEKLIGQFLPKLSKHLEKEHIHITMFATQWLLTLYTSSFPFELVTRVWDCFLAEGWKIIYRVMLAILDNASPDLMKLHFEEILGYFRDLPGKVDGDAIFAKVFGIPLKRRHIEKYEAEWSAQQQSRS